jgi:hypothetical protein
LGSAEALPIGRDFPTTETKGVPVRDGAAQFANIYEDGIRRMAFSGCFQGILTNIRVIMGEKKILDVSLGAPMNRRIESD